MANNSTTMDGNTAAAHVAYRVNEVCAIFPITPSSTMAELADEWSAAGIPNIWGNVPVVQEMQSEGGAAGAVHGALQAGALTTTFTASQGLLLMIPNMFKIAGELTPTVFHVAARSIATQALSIFGDHSDVMATRTTGFALLSSGSVQEAHDAALIAQAATLQSRVPFVHFFDGFRTSHEINTLHLLSDADIRAMIDDELVRAHRARALDPQHPFIRGTAHNPDTFFQAARRSIPSTPGCRKSCRPPWTGSPRSPAGHTVSSTMKAPRMPTGGHPDGLRRRDRAPDCGRLTGSPARRWACFRCGSSAPSRPRISSPRCPQPAARLPSSSRPRSRAPAANRFIWMSSNRLAQAVSRDQRPSMPRVIGGRYGLSSKDFSPAMAKAVFDELKKPDPKNGFTVGITDDVSHTQPGLRPRLFDRARRRGARGLLRPRRRWHGGREQEQREDHRRGRRALCAGLFRL